MSKWLYFHASAIDSSSVTSHDTGTNIDFGAFPADSLTAVMAEEDMVYLYFNNATRFQGSIGSATEVMEQAYVRLITAEGKEHTVVERLLNLITSPNKTVIKFDAVTPSWPIENVTAIQIRRHLTTHTIASD